MRNIVDLPINLSVDYAKRHRYQLAHFFNHFSILTNQRLKTPLLAYKINPEQFDTLGTLWVKKSELDKRSLRLLQIIEDSYMSMSFFSSKNDRIGSRGFVYYNSALIDDDNIRAYLRLISQATISVQLLEEHYEKYMDRWEFGIYALLDDIRYKLLILEDAHPQLFANNEPLSTAITMFYEYAQGTMPAPHQVHKFTERLHAAFFVLLEQSPPVVLRSYKEADHPLQNLQFRETFAELSQNIQIDTIVGIRFGGAELPHLLQTYLPHATIDKVRVSKYSGNTNSINPDRAHYTNRSVLIVDDNILTGRTLQELVDTLTAYQCRAVYFGCVTYSGIKRYHQMLMEGHGVINPEVLLRACVISESHYTKITNSRSYKNKNGVFDKVKTQLQKRMSNPQLRYRL